MCPVRRNVTANPSHIENFGSKDYEEDLVDFHDQEGKLLGEWATCNGGKL
jgi:hypothetical protein